MLSRLNNRYKKGLWAEYYACLRLLPKGYWPLHHRFKTPVGEIDLIVRRGRTIIFVEVKSRPTLEKGLLSVSEKQKMRNMRAADYFLMQNPCYNDLIRRFDVMVIFEGLKCEHLKNINM